MKNNQSLENQMDKDRHFMVDTFVENVELKWINTETKF